MHWRFEPLLSRPPADCRYDFNHILEGETQMSRKLVFEQPLRWSAAVMSAGRGWLIGAVLLTVPLVFYGAGQALKTRNNDIRQWLPGGLTETQQYDWFLEHFGSEEFALISWNEANLDDARISELAARLRTHVADPSAKTTGLFREIVTGPELLAQLQSEPLSLSRSEAVDRLQGSLLGADGATTGLLARLSEQGHLDRHAAISVIRREALSVGVPSDSLRLGGPTVDSVALDQESERSRYLWTAVSLILGSLAAWRCLRRVSLVAVVLLTAVYCGALTLAWVHVFGDELNMIMVTMPTLVYVLTISGAIHVTHYFQTAVREHGQKSAAQHALRAGWLPCVLTAVTTAIGLGSLQVSHVTPIRLFGFYSALGVISSLPVILFFLPSVLSLIPGGRREERTPESGSMNRMNAVIHRVGQAVIRRHRLIVVSGALVMVVSVVGVSRLQTSVKLINFFSPESRVIADYRWLESELSPLVPVEVVLRVPGSHKSSMVLRMVLAEEVQNALSAMPDVDGAMSAATFTPDESQQRGVMKFARRVAMNRRLEKRREDLMATGYLAMDGDDELWRVSARVGALNDIDYGLFIRQLESAVAPVLAEHAGRSDDGDPIEAVYTGVVPLVYKAQRVLLDDLTVSFLTAFAIIGVVMVFLMGGVGAGLVSMLPNTFPALVVFGAMGWMGEHCDIGAMITASVALGIAVDDTIHFMNWFRRGLASGMKRQAAILFAYERCGTAMLTTTLICGLGMLGFAFSSFGPTSGFATLMITLLVAALVGDLLFLPALLASPLGALFERRRAARYSSDPQSALEPSVSLPPALHSLSEAASRG